MCCSVYFCSEESYVDTLYTLCNKARCDRMRYAGNDCMYCTHKRLDVCVGMLYLFFTQHHLLLDLRLCSVSVRWFVIDPLTTTILQPTAIPTYEWNRIGKKKFVTVICLLGALG